MDARVCKGAILCDGFALQAERPEVRERVVAWVVVICIAANKGAESKDGVGVDQARPARGDVECADLRALLLHADGLTTRCESATRGCGRSKPAIVNDDAKPRRSELRVERIGRLKPGTRVYDV